MENDKNNTSVVTPEFRKLGATMFDQYDGLLTAADAGNESPARLLARIEKFVKEAERMVREARKIQRALLAVAAVSLAFTVSACAVIPRPDGATPAQWEGIQANCRLHAAKEIPPAFISTVTPGMNVETSNCHKGTCNSTEIYIPPSLDQVDTNTPLRNDATNACLAQAALAFQPKQ